MKVSWEPENGLSSSSSEDENGFSMRLALCAKRYGSATALAKKAGMSQSTLHRYSRGSEPNRAHLVAIARAAEVNLAWLATGEGAMTADAESPHVAESQAVYHSSALNLDLLETVVRATEKKFAAERISLSPSEKARAIRLIYELFSRRSEPPDEATLDNVIDLAAHR